MMTAVYPSSESRPMVFPSGAAALVGGLLTAFTISIGGEMPVGELVLCVVFGWIVLCALVNGSLPAELPRTQLFRVLLACQVVAFAAYVVSDLYRHSTPHDIARGWARMVFLAIDIIGIAYLFGCSKMNLLLFMAGSLLGDSLHAVLFGALFGDMWKFGVGVPLTYLVLFLAALLSRPAFILAAFVMSAVHFVLDYRSFGGLCLLAATATLLTMFPRGRRAWMLAPAVVIVGLGLAGYFLGHHDPGQRSTRSDISRSSMMKAAAQGFESSPLIGQGSWFSRSEVFSNFMAIRAEVAKEEHIGGFPEAHDDPGSVAIHSQILVALAEGGIFGAAFFLAFGAAVVFAIYRLVFVQDSSQFTGLYLLILMSALFNWFLSPFSGAHRVYIAIACGLILFLQPARPAQVLAA
jgi:hypothetical protein